MTSNRHNATHREPGRSFAGRTALAILATTAGLAACNGEGFGPLRPLAARPPACADVTFPIYFSQGSDELTATAKQVAAASVAQVRSCRIGYVSVLGLTDAQGDKATNLDLSKRRADAVARLLAADGLPPARFEVQGDGENGATSDSGHAVPLRRKTEVVIHALPQ